jgi:hypothetical protein
MLRMGLEGIVSKRKDSTYRSGRSPDWLEMKNIAHRRVRLSEQCQRERWFPDSFDVARANTAAYVVAADAVWQSIAICR